MEYFLDEHKTLYAYDEGTKLSFEYKNLKWELTKYVFLVIDHDYKLQPIFKDEAIKITNNSTPDDLLKSIKEVLDMDLGV